MRWSGLVVRGRDAAHIMVQEQEVSCCTVIVGKLQLLAEPWHGQLRTCDYCDSQDRLAGTLTAMLLSRIISQECLECLDCLNLTRLACADIFLDIL